MLVLARKPNESVAVGGLNRPEPLLKVTVLEIGASRVILGFEADKDVPVHRWEVRERIVTDVQIKCDSGSKPRQRLTVARRRVQKRVEPVICRQ